MKQTIRGRPSLLTAGVLAAVLVACDGTPPVAPESAATAMMAVDAPPVVLNTQLRAPADDAEPSAAYGHVQVRFTNLGDGNYVADWAGKVFNPEGETFIAGALGIINPDILPPGDDVPEPGEPLLLLFAGDGVQCSTVVFDSKGIINPDIIPAGTVDAIVAEPSAYEVRLFTTERTGGAVQGTFGASTPEGAASGGSASGPRVRCEA